MILVNSKTREPVKLGDEIISFRGERATVIGWMEPKHSGSTGRVQVVDAKYGGFFYPSVYGLEWEDRQ